MAIAFPVGTSLWTTFLGQVPGSIILGFTANKGSSVGKKKNLAVAWSSMWVALEQIVNRRKDFKYQSNLET